MMERLELGSQAYLFNSSSVISSVAITNNLIRYLDYFAKDLIAEKLSFIKAFHVTTRLLKRI